MIALRPQWLSWKQGREILRDQGMVLKREHEKCYHPVTSTQGRGSRKSLRTTASSKLIQPFCSEAKQAGNLKKEKKKTESRDHFFVNKYVQQNFVVCTP